MSEDKSLYTDDSLHASEFSFSASQRKWTQQVLKTHGMLRPKCAVTFPALSEPLSFSFQTAPQADDGQRCRFAGLGFHLHICRDSEMRCRKTHTNSLARTISNVMALVLSPAAHVGTLQLSASLYSFHEEGNPAPLMPTSSGLSPGMVCSVQDGKGRQGLCQGPASDHKQGPR